MNLSTNVNFLLGLQVQMKINHWQTKGFARHQAFGGFYDDMDPLIDKFVECAMGKRLLNNKIPIRNGESTPLESSGYTLDELGNRDLHNFV